VAEHLQAVAIVAAAGYPANAAKKIAFVPGSDRRHDPEIPCADFHGHEGFRRHPSQVAENA
jgi:hypothetical protein